MDADDCFRVLLPVMINKVHEQLFVGRLVFNHHLLQVTVQKVTVVGDIDLREQDFQFGLCAALNDVPHLPDLCLC
jgi:hypothetical protein